MRRILPVVLTTIAAFIAACGSAALHPTSTTAPAPPSLTSPAAPPPGGQTGTGAITFPKDGVQPWEKLDGAGHVIPDSQSRSAAAALGANSQFASGSQRFLEGGGFSNFGTATKLSSPAGGAVAYVMYRFSLGAAQPGVITVDANLHGPGAKYYVAVSNFQLSHWEWYGPFSDAQIALPISLSSATSNLGNTFVTVAAFDNAEVDVVGVGVTPRDVTDTTAPPAPSAPVATPVAGGLELTWIPVVAGDLAGYRVYYSSGAFNAPGQAGVQQLPWLEGTTRVVVPAGQRLTFVALSAVDVSGNASPLSPVTSAVPLTGALPAVQLTTSAVSGRLNDAVTLSATGASSYDFDLDGDGIYEVTGNTSGTAQVDTTQTGLIRPHVRGTNGGGTAVALGGVSLIINGNQPPIAVITHQGPMQGAVPFTANLSGTSSTDPDGTIVEYAWDVQSDGIYDTTSPTDPDRKVKISAAATANIRLRVTDDQGAWGVDSIVATGINGVLQLYYEPSLQSDQSTPIYAVYSGPEQVVSIDWDLNGDGTVDQTLGPTDPVTFGPVSPGQTEVDAVATLDSGGLARGLALITVHGWYVFPYQGAGGGANYVSGALCGGLPAISFIDSGGQLCFQSSQDTVGYQWNSLVQPAPGATATRQSILTLSNGRVGIAFWDSAVGHLEYLYALDDTGSTWSAPLALENFGYSASNISTALIGGKPAVAYYHAGLKDPLFVLANDALGTSWAGPQVVSNDPGDDGQRISLAEIDGVPAVAYASPGPTLTYCQAKNSAGSAWNTPIPVDILNADTSPLALASVAGYPSIAYTASALGGSALLYISANDPDGASWIVPTTLVDIDTSSSILAPAMLDVAGVPWITYSRDGRRQMLARGTSPSDPGFNIEACCSPEMFQADGTSGFFAQAGITYVVTGDAGLGTATLASKF